MVEKDMQTFWGKHIQVYPPSETEAYELKICKGTSFPFNSLKDHQIQALLNAEEGSLYHRITDQPWMPQKNAFTYKKPFDCFCLVKVKSFVIIWFYRPRYPKVIIKIPIRKFVTEMLNSKRKSLTEDRAKEIGISILMA